MVPVILHNRKYGTERVKDGALDSIFVQRIRIIFWKFQKTANIVINDPHFHPFYDFHFQNIQNTIP